MKVVPKTGSVHNPLIELEKAMISKIKEINAKETDELERHIPKIRGIHPLSLVEEYKRYWQEFLADHRAIDITPTRRYHGVFKGFHNNAKRSYGIVKIFCPFREDDYKKSRIEATFRREFEFQKPPYSSDRFITLLELYVRALRSIPPSQRQTIAGDFYMIVKAIRIRPKVHRKLIDTARFYELVMSYFLLVNQPHLALYTAVRVVPKSIPGSTDRWCILKLLKLPEILVGEDGTTSTLKALQDIDSGMSPNSESLDFDYRVNLMTRSILEYYYAKPNVVITDMELFGLMRCFMSRLQAKELMDLLPLVLKRLVKGLPAELPEADSVELFLEDHGHRDPATFEQIVATYALGFVHVGCKDMAIKFLQTVANLPSTPMAHYVGLTGSLVLSLIEIAKCVPEKSPVLTMHLTQIANGPYYRATQFMKAVDYKAKMADDIIEYMTTDQIKLATATTGLLSSLSRKLNFFAAFAILQRLEKISEPLAYEWLAGAIPFVRIICVKELVNWSQGADRLIWREMLRHGIEPNLMAIQISLRRRLVDRLDIKQSAELMSILIRHLKPSNEHNPDFDDEGAALTEEDEWAESEDSASKDSSPDFTGIPSTELTTHHSKRAFIALIDGLNYAGLHELVNLVAIYILTRPFCNHHILRVVASVWLDSAGYDPEATSDEVYYVWEAINKYADLLRERRPDNAAFDYSLNSNNFNSLIEAFVRKGDLNMAWRVIREEMPKHDYTPDKRTFYVLVSQLSVSGRLWPLGKAMVARFNKHYPGPVAAALKDSDCSHTLKAMIYAGIRESAEN
ncbi:hypothetical protein LPJ53_001542 [Coemansia erecta]|uniref:Uncharacterized protein n=1 Tax=Coemansia erecta TaxID=147472 RepID=A0A9W7Y3R5_9FUNG|nr:hypothetical protein LPJ53_001542 [Coemansia erecta]